MWAVYRAAPAHSVFTEQLSAAARSGVLVGGRPYPYSPWRTAHVRHSAQPAPADPSGPGRPMRERTFRSVGRPRRAHSACARHQSQPPSSGSDSGRASTSSRLVWISAPLVMLRAARGLSVEQLAEGAKVHPETIEHWSWHDQGPLPGSRRRPAAALNVPLFPWLWQCGQGTGPAGSGDRGEPSHRAVGGRAATRHAGAARPMS